MFLPRLVRIAFEPGEASIGEVHVEIQNESKGGLLLELQTSSEWQIR
jgi:hypothetical protein